jgi:hypothetical protein
MANKKYEYIKDLVERDSLGDLGTGGTDILKRA